MRRTHKLSKAHVKQLHERKITSEKRKRELIEYIEKLKEQYQKRKISYARYVELIHQKRNGRTIEEWIHFYHLEALECHRRIQRHKNSKAKRGHLILIILSIVLIILISLMFKNITQTGLVSEGDVSQFKVKSFSQNIDVEFIQKSKSFNQTNNLEWTPENQGQLKSLKLSGSIEGEGKVQIYLGELLVLDSSNIKKTKSRSITALASLEIELVEESEEEPEVIEEEIPEETEEPSESEEEIPNEPIEETLEEENQTEIEEIDETILDSNITEEIQEEEEEQTIKSFREVCEETCNLEEFNLSDESYDLRIEISDAKIQINKINYEIISEEINEIIEREVNKTEIIETPETNATVTTQQFQAIIGQPVKWKKEIKLDKEDSVTIRIPKDAENITAYKIEKTKGTRTASSVSEKQKTDISVTGMVISSTEGKGIITKIWNSLQRIFSSMTGRAVDTEEIKVTIEDNSTEYELEYYTEAPQAFEEEIQDGKRITITGPDELHYQDVLAFTELENELSKDRIILYHIIDDSRQQVSFDSYDLNENGLIDYIKWIVPHLSEQVYELSENNGTFFEGFESNNLSTNNWETSGEGDPGYIDSYDPYTGTYHAVIKPKGAESIIETNISTIGYENILFSFYAQTGGLDSGEYIAADWYNGTDWTNVLTQEDIYPYAPYNYNLSDSAEDNTNFRIRFRCLCNLKAESCQLDNIQITGTEIQAEPGENVTINETVEDSSENPINVTLEIEDENNNIIYNETSTSHSRGIAKGHYKIKLKPKNHIIKQIQLKSFNSTYFNLTKDINEIIDIEDPEDNQGWDELYSINPQINQTNTTIEITIDSAKSNMLYKCADWDFSTQTCSGEWIKWYDMIPGQSYTFSMSLEDPAFAERNQTTNYLFNTADPQYPAYKEMKNETVGGTTYTTPSISVNALGVQCGTTMWINANSTSLRQYNGTWSFSVYSYCTSAAVVGTATVRIFKYNGTEHIIATTSDDENMCTQVGAPGTLRTWDYVFPQTINISAGERIGIQLCINVTTSKNKLAYFEYEGTSPSNVVMNTSTVTIDNAPNWSSQSQNISTILPGESVNLSTYWVDDYNLHTAKLSTNETGTWQNKTTYGSPLSIIGISNWSNFTWSNESISNETKIGWRIWANDSRNLWNVTNIMAFNIIPLFEISIINPKNTTYNFKLMELVTSIDEGAQQCWYSLNGGSNTFFTCNSDVNITAIEGDNNITVYGNNTEGYTANDTQWFSVNTSQALGIFIISPENNTLTSDPTPDLDLLAIDYATDTINYTTYIYYADGTFYATGNTGTLTNNTLKTITLNPALDLVAKSNTNYKIIVSANDTLSNVKNSSELFLTLGPPVVSLIYPPNNFLSNDGNINFTFDYEDPVETIANCSLYINDVYNQSNSSTQENVTTSFIVTGLPDGLNQNWTINCNIGENIENDTRILSVDTTPPAVFDLKPTQGTIYEDTQDIEIAANVTNGAAIDTVLANITYPNNTIIQLELSNSIGDKYNTSFTIPYLKDQYNITIIANDTGGLINNTETTYFTLNDSTPPRVTLIHPWGFSHPGHYHDENSDVDITIDVTDLTAIDTILANITFPNQTSSVIVSDFGYPLPSDNFDTDTEGVNWVHANTTSSSQTCFTDIDGTVPDKMFISVDGGTGPSMHCAFNSLKRVIGNYDLNITFNITHMEDDSFFTLRSAPTDSLAASGLRVYIALIQNTGGNRIYRLAYYNGTDTYQNNIDTTDTYGKFRIKRSNMTTTGTPVFNLYYWNNTGNHWIESSFGNISLPGSLRPYFIQIKPGSQASGYGALNITLDDFQISSDNYTFAIFNQTASTGTYNVTMIVNDTLGYVNNTEKSIFEIEEINDPPSRPYIEEPDIGDIVTGLSNISWGQVTDDEGDNLRFNITLLNPNNGTNATIISNYGDISTTWYEWNTTQHLDGNYKLRVTVFENETAEGNSNSDILGGNFTIDNSAPQVTIIYPLNNTINQNKDVAITLNIIENSIDTIQANVTFPDNTSQIINNFGYSLPNDNFDTDTEGINWIHNNITSVGQTCTTNINGIVPGKMNIYISGGTGPSTAQCGFNSLKRLDGNFDINISFNLTTFEDDALFSFRSNNVDSFSATGVRVFTDIEKEGGVISYTFGYNNGTATSQQSTITTDTSGKFRIKRFNMTTTGTPTFNLYYWNNTGNHWVNMLGNISLTESARTQFVQIKPASVGDGFGIINMTLDDFQISSDNYTFAIFNNTAQTGLYNVSIFVNDSQEHINNTEYTTFNIITVNTIPSRPFMVEPDPNDVVGGLFNISWSQVIDDEGDNLRFNITLLNPNNGTNATLVSNYGDNSTIRYEWNTTQHLEGNYSLRITVYENETAEGNSNSDTLGGNFTIDNTLPIVIIHSPINDTYDNLTVLVNISASDASGIHKIWYNWNNTNITYISPINITFDEGNNTLYAYANDTARNENFTRVIFTLITTAPTITFIPPTPNNNAFYNSNQVIINASVTNSINISTCVLDWNGTNETMNKIGTGDNITCYSNKTNLSQTNYTYKIYANNTIGTTNVSDTRNITIDYTLPEIQFTLPTPNSGSIVETIPVNVTASDSLFANLTLRLYNSNHTLIDYTTTTNTSFFENFTGLAMGIYYFNATAFDLAGNENSTETRNVTVSYNDTTPPSITSIFPAPGATYNVSDSINISAAITDPSGVNYSYINITLPNETITQLELINIGGDNYSIEFSDLIQKGIYNISFFANDTEGNTNDTETTWVERVVPGNKIFDITDTELDYINYVSSVISNVSGILTIEINITEPGYNIKKIIIEGYDETSPCSVIRIRNSTNDSSYLENTYMIDLTDANLTLANITITASGYHLFKCTTFNQTTLECDDEFNYTMIDYGLTPGQNYTISLNKTDPLFGETIQGPENTSDATMRSGAPDTNYGGVTRIRVGRRIAGDRYRGIISFNLSHIPSNATITSANLSLYFINIPTGDSNDSRTHGVHKIQQNPPRPWTELNVTANSYNGTDNWDTLGGDFNATPADTVAFDNNSLNSWVTFDVTSDAENFTDNPLTNFGWVIKDQSETTNNHRRDFASSENTNAAIRPVLNISYTTPNNPPSITYVSSISNTDPIEASSNSITFYATMYDIDGVAELNDTSVRANFTRAGEPTRENLTCIHVNDINANSANYSCTIDMWYFDEAGNWNITVYGEDTNGGDAINDSTYFQYNQLQAIVISPSNITFTASPSSFNQTGNNDPTIINNTGNANLTNKISVKAIDLIGETNASEYLVSEKFSIGVSTGGSPPAECSGTILQNATEVNITGIILDRGNLSAGQAQEEIYYCITEIGSFSGQVYSTQGAGNWLIKIALSMVIVAVKKRKKRKRKIIVDDLSIPITIFTNKLGGLEGLVKYLKENLEMTYHEIAELLNRDDRTIWTAYNKSVKKQPTKLIIRKTLVFLPISILKNRKLTILEAITVYLKDKEMKYIEIAELLNRDQRNIWTIYSRAIKK